MKYVTIQLRSPRDKTFTKDFVVAFPNDFVHAIMGEALLVAAAEQWPDYQAELVAAGDIDVMAYATTGHSETLKLKAREVDQQSFNTADYGGNVNVPKGSK